MKYHDSHFHWMWPREDWDNEYAFLFGFVTGKVEYSPVARYLHTFRVFFGPIKFEILWTTGEINAQAIDV